MGWFKALVVLTSMSALALVGCGDDDNQGSAGSGGSAGAGGTAGSGGSQGTVAVDLRVIAFEPGSDTDPPFEGAEVCEQGTDNCETSDSEGNVQLDVPANSEIIFEVTAEGYGPTLTPQTTTTEDVTTQLTPLLTIATLELLAGSLGVDYPPTDTGLVAVSVLTEPIDADNNGIGGVTITPDQEGMVYYLDENEFPTFDISATTAPSGAGGLVEAEPRTWELTLGGTASNCIVVTGWPGSTENSIRVPVQTGLVTQAFVTCDPVE